MGRRIHFCADSEATDLQPSGQSNDGLFGRRYAASLLERFPFVRQLIPINQLMCHPERHLGKAGLQKAGLPTHEETD
jgi:hypothetical protein